jgi:hypothetical protein
MGERRGAEVRDQRERGRERGQRTRADFIVAEGAIGIRDLNSDPSESPKQSRIFLEGLQR